MKVIKCSQTITNDTRISEIKMEFANLKRLYDRLSPGDELSLGKNFVSKQVWDEIQCPCCMLQLKEAELKRIKEGRTVLPVKKLYKPYPIYEYFRRRYCPVCRKELTVRDSTLTLYPGLPEAKGYDFAMQDGRVADEMIFMDRYYYCGICKKKYSIDNTLT